MTQCTPAPLTLDPLAPVRVLVIPGLHDSGPGHWQTWLQGQYQGAVRVVQSNWHHADLPAWSERIALTLRKYDPRTQWVAVAHSFGCLALAHHLGRSVGSLQEGRPLPGGGVKAALLVAPASPDKFGIRSLLPQQALGLPATLVGSETDPWMSGPEAQGWADTWGLAYRSLGDAGHINAESGFGPWPLARCKVDQLIRDLHQARRHDPEPALRLSVAI